MATAEYVPGSLAVSLTDSTVKNVAPVLVKQALDAKFKNKKKRKSSGPDFETADSSETSKKKRVKRLSKEEAKEKDERTIFVGNIPVEATRKDIKAFFQKVGAVESVRIRSVAIELTKISKAKNYKLSRKASYITGKINTEVKDNINAYVVFKKKESVEKAVGLNGVLFKGNHLRLDTIVKDTSSAIGSHKKTAFIGNLPFDTSEEKVRQFFALSVSGGDECISNVRLIRDRATNKGKGFGYILFAERSLVKEATALNGAVFEGRKLRISKVDPNFKESQKMRRYLSKDEKSGSKQASRKNKFQGDTAKFGAYMRIKRKKKRGETSSSVKNNKKFRSDGRGGGKRGGPRR